MTSRRWGTRAGHGKAQDGDPGDLKASGRRGATRRRCEVLTKRAKPSLVSK